MVIKRFVWWPWQFHKCIVSIIRRSRLQNARRNALGANVSCQSPGRTYVRSPACCPLWLKITAQAWLKCVYRSETRSKVEAAPRVFLGRTREGITAGLVISGDSIRRSYRAWNIPRSAANGSYDSSLHKSAPSGSRVATAVRIYATRADIINRKIYARWRGIN